MRYKIMALLMLFLIPIYVNADAINISCPTEVVSNSEFSCDITGTTTGGVTDVTFKISLSSGLTFVTFIKGSGWNGEGDLSSVDLYGGDTFTGTFKFGTLKVRSGESGGTITLYDTVFYNNSKTLSVDNVSRKVNIKSSGGSSNPTSSPTSNPTGNPSKNSNPTSNPASQPPSSSSPGQTTEEPDINLDNGAYLSDLKIKGYDINFRKDVFNYDLTIGSEKKLEITPVGGNDDITYEIIGNEDLKDGSLITIEVRYKEEEIQNYYINIKKKNRSVPIFITIIVVLIMFNVVRIIFSKTGGKNEKDS